jgi:hypothetical protein
MTRATIGTVILKALIVWFVMMVLAILNGITRNSLYEPRIGEQAAHVVSSITLCVLIVALAWITNPWVAPGTTRAAFGVGLLWLSLTVAFEFLAGHYAFGHSWGKLLADYDLTRGRVWILVLVTTFLAPALAERLRGP